MTITSDGRPAARLEPVAARLSSHTLVERSRLLPDVEPTRLRRDVDAVLDQQV